MAHLDVVPVDESAPWRHPAFDAVVDDGAVWGRGTLDDKGSLVALCEAVETLLTDGFVPAQDVWLSFGADEEVSGRCAPAAVAELERRGVVPWFVLDEGGAVAADAFPGVAAPLAVVGVTEKGTTNLELRTEGRGGHSSMPSRMDTTARLARAILRLEHSPFPARVHAPTLEMLRRVAPHAPAALRPLIANAHRATPLLARALVAAGPETAAMTRTTATVTTLEGSPALNVIASTARAGVNVRVLVGDTVASVVEHVRKAIHDESVTVEVLEAGEPSPVSPIDDDAFRLITDTIEAVFPDAVATPYIMMGATDARFFTALCPRVYRYTPFRMSRAQRASLHSFDEHLGVEDLADGTRWYRLLLEGLPS
jgi:carboxypeptidase PM20D1